MEAKTGRVVAMASNPSYDPNAWVGGISGKDYSKLTGKGSNYPLLNRAIQGQSAPGSIFKVVSDRRRGQRRLLLRRHATSAPARTPSAARSSRTSSPRDTARSASAAPWRSPATPSSTASPTRSGSGTAASSRRRTPRTGSTRPPTSSASARRPASTCRTRSPAASPTASGSRTTGRPTRTPGASTARRAARTPSRSRTRTASKATGCAPVTPSTTPSARATRSSRRSRWRRSTAAISNGGTLYDPTVGKAIISPDGKTVQEIKPKSHGKLPMTQKTLDEIDGALEGVATRGTAAWRFGGWPQDKIPMHAKTGTAEVYGKQTTSWFATYTKDYTVVMTISQGGTGSGASGPAVRKIYNALYGVSEDGAIDKKKALLYNPAEEPAEDREGRLDRLPEGRDVPAEEGAGLRGGRAAGERRRPGRHRARSQHRHTATPDGATPEGAARHGRPRKRRRATT